MPEEKDMHRLPRQWIVNMLFTIVGEPISAWVSLLIEERN
jgi:hypothetical protein